MANKFERSEIVVCKKQDWYLVALDPCEVPAPAEQHPRVGDECEIESVITRGSTAYLVLNGFPHRYDARCFRPKGAIIPDIEAFHRDLADVNMLAGVML